MGVAEFSRARDRLLAVDALAPSASEVCETIVEAFHDVLRFDRCAVMTTDPQTYLPSGGVVEGFRPEDCTPFWENELADPDFNKFTDLARRLEPIATLADAVDGDLMRSPRYAKLYAAAEAPDELRLVFLAGTSCLGVGVFLRPTGAGEFTAPELTDATQLLPVATTVLRHAYGRLRQDASARPPVVVVLAPDDAVVAVSAGGMELLEDLRVNGVDGDLPSVVKVAAAKARATRSVTSLTTQLRGRSGRWLRLHVSPMEGDDEHVVVTVEPAPPDDLVRILLDSYGLTPRETDIVLLVCRGLATKEIARELTISVHTVRDHLKVIYGKAGVASRGELAAQLFSNHVLDRMHQQVSHVAERTVLSASG